MSGFDSAVANSLLAATSREISNSKEELSRLDAVAGDGDHGVNMAAAFADAERRVAEQLPVAAAGVFGAISESFLETVGGAAGALMGVFFRAVATRLAETDAPEAGDFVAGLRQGLDQMVRIGKAEPGDKTMVDALTPSIEAAERIVELSAGLGEAMTAASSAAISGAEATADMRPALGRAKFSGDASLGTPDPGATTVAIMFSAWADALNREVTT